MKSIYVFSILLAGTLLFSCRKDRNNPPPVTPPPASDAQTLLLKDLVVQNLPAPYYHFEYDDSGYITKSGFSSGLRSYDVSYSSRRIGEMRSTHAINKDKLLYQYENGKPFLIKYMDQGGINYKRCFISYNADGQLDKMEWDRKMANAGFAIERTLSFTYYADGNLHRLTDQRHAIDNQQTEATHIDEFENYDNKVNPDGFSLIHNNNDHLILLPGVKLQKNNPLKNIRTGTGLHYEISYAYTYDDIHRPILKNGDAAITNGPGTGQHFQTTAAFTYYP